MNEIVELHIPCEKCGSSDARCIYRDGHSYCYSCNNYISAKRDFIDLSYTYEYLPWRGVSKEIMKFYDVKTKIDAEGKPIELGFPYPNGSCKVRSLEKKDFRTVGDISSAGLFGRNLFTAGSNKYVTITEGELDALSLREVVGSPVVSVQSASSAHRDCSRDRSWLNSFERVLIAFDADSPGRDAAAQVAKLFDYNKVFQVKFDRHKDANACLTHGGRDELRTIWWNAKPYLPDSVKSSFSDFETILQAQHRDGVPYPFPTLNEMTYGIRTGESVLITAQEGVGKTELMHAIEYQLLRETNDNIGAIFLEEPQRRHLQAIAGIHLQRPAHLPDAGCSDAQVYGAVKEAVGVDDRLHIYSHFGSDDPEVIVDTIRFLASARLCRFILLDHITMVVSGSTEDDERRKLDYLATKLEMLVKELDIALIIVSHVNDFGQTRGSRYIGKIADIRIDLKRDVASGSFDTHLTVAKNRFCGRTGPAGIITFNPNTYTYKEAANDNGDANGGHRSVSAA